MDINNDNILLQIFRNRSEMEATITNTNTGEVIDRVPVEWKSRNNKLDYLSVSKIQAYEQCPACFYQQYMAEETISVDNANYFTKFGSIMHAVCEEIMKIYMFNGFVMPVEAVLKEVWETGGLQGFADYEQCKKLLITYFEQNPVAERNESPILIEKEWRGELGGITFGLMIDYVGQYKDDHDKYILRDYKTNRMPYTSAELQNSLQLRIYNLVLKRHYLHNAKKIIAGYDLFFHGWQQCPQWSDDDLLVAEEYVSAIANQIRSDNVWEEKLNNYCCYRNCRHTCHTYQKFLKNAQSFFIAFDNTDIEQVEQQRELMTAIEKNAKQRKDECASIIKAEIEERAKNNDKLVIGEKELQLYSPKKQSYRYHDTKNVLLSQGKDGLLEDCLSIQKTKLDKKLDANTKLQLAGCLSTNYSAPYIIKKNI